MKKTLIALSLVTSLIAGGAMAFGSVGGPGGPGSSDAPTAALMGQYKKSHAPAPAPVGQALVVITMTNAGLVSVNSGSYVCWGTSSSASSWLPALSSAALQVYPPHGIAVPAGTLQSNCGLSTGVTTYNSTSATWVTGPALNPPAAGSAYAIL